MSKASDHYERHPQSVPGTLASIMLAVDCTIECSRPVFVSKGVVRELVMFELVSQCARRKTLWQRITFAWGLVLEVFHA